VIGTSGANGGELAAARHARDVRADRLRDLHGIRADAAGCTDHEHALAGGHSGCLDRLDGRTARDRENRRLVERQRRRLLHELVLAGARELRERTATDAEHLVADLEPRHACTDLDDGAREIETRNRRRGRAESVAHETHEVRAPRHQVPRASIEPGCRDPDEDLAGARCRARRDPDLEHIGGAVPGLENRAHRASDLDGGGDSVEGFGLRGDRCVRHEESPCSLVVPRYERAPNRT
jgi:hypothetical protein